jgi:hypothetical protein
MCQYQAQISSLIAFHGKYCMQIRPNGYKYIKVLSVIGNRYYM